MAILKAISPVNQPFDILDNTVNIINNYMAKDGPGIVLLDSIMHAAKKVSKEIKLPCPFHKLLMSNDFQTIELAGHVSEQLASMLYTDLDKQLAIMSDSYSLIAVLCYGRLGQYRNTASQNIFKCATEVFALLVVDEEMRKKRGITYDSSN